MADKLTEKQSQFIEEIKERFQDPEWSVSSFYKFTEQYNNWNTYKLTLVLLAMDLGLYFLEKPNFLHIGKNHNLCEMSDAKLSERISQNPPPPQVVANRADNIPN